MLTRVVLNFQADHRERLVTAVVHAHLAGHRYCNGQRFCNLTAGWEAKNKLPH